MSLPLILKDRRLWIVLGIAVLFLAVRWSGLTSYLTLDTLRAHRSELTVWVERHVLLAGLIYVLAYILAVAFSLPGAAFLTIMGGFLFGTTIGTLLTVTGATIGATIIFTLAKTIFGNDALDRFGGAAAKIASGIRCHAGSYLMVLRLVPLFPFFLVNLVPAFVGVRPSTFIVTTFFGILPGTIVFSLAGCGVGSILDQGGDLTIRSIMTPQVIASLVGLALLSLAAIPIKQRLAARDQ